MKKIFIVATAAIMLCMACSKENILHEKIILSEMSDIEEDIIDFLDNIDEPIEGSLPVNDAVFFLEAGFNYRYAHAGNDTIMTATTMDTTFINLPVYEGNASYADLADAFEDIYDEMTSVFNAIEDDEKALSIIQVSQVSANTLQVISVWRHSVLSFSGDWFWGWKHGKCDNTRFGRDATDAIKFFYTINFSSPQGYGLWTNVSFSNQYYAENNLMDISSSPNQFGYEDKLLFQHVQSTYYVTHCMAQNENYYYASLLPTAISRIENQEGINKDLISVFMLCKQTQLASPPNELYRIQHGIQLMHGDWISTTHIAADDFFAI